MFLFTACCGGGRHRKHQSEQQPDETTRLLATSDALFPQVAEAPQPIDDEALLAYQRRIDKILEETAEKLISVNTPSNALMHTQSNASSSNASSSTTKPSDGGPSPRQATSHHQSHHLGSNGRDTIWRAEPAAAGGTNKNSVYSMKKVSSPKTAKNKQSSKAKGKQASLEGRYHDNGDTSSSSGGAGLLVSPSTDDDETSTHNNNTHVGITAEHHDRDATYASYKTARQGDPDDTETETQEGRPSSRARYNRSIRIDNDNGSISNGTSELGSDSDERESTAAAYSAKPGHKPMHAQEIFATSSGPNQQHQLALAKEKTQKRLEKALTMSDEDFAKHLTQK